jgi:starch synthase (maltosyl-transferring)
VERLARPIRLTFLITDLQVGGVPLHLYRLATGLDPDCVRARVISLANEGPVGLRLRQGGIPVLACGARSVRDLPALWRLRQLLRADPPDVLHAMLFHANLAARLIGPLSGVPIHRIICEIQTVEIERRWHLILDNLTCRLCALEVGNSPSVIQHLHAWAHLPMSRLRCEWGSVEEARIQAAVPVPRAALGVDSNELLILWVGRFDPIKGFEEMLAGVALASQRLPLRLVLAGEGDYRPQIERLIREYALEDRVLLLGARSDVASLLRSADLFLLPSRTEGLPNALLEAMAAGLPILATDVPGCRDLIRHGETGWLVRPRSANCIARGIEALAQDREMADAMGQRARAWVLAHATPDRWIGNWVRLYQQIATDQLESRAPRIA